ncbi:MAG: amidohydrolase family protein [Bauldia sp.]|nr:amidohydrolase family protein [Bauldia sp.]
MSDTPDQGGGPASVDLVIRNAYVITMDDDARIIEAGAVAVDRGRIVAVDADSVVAAGYTGRRQIDAGGAPLHPGFIECHMHASFQLTRGGMADQLVEADAFRLFESDFFNIINDDEEYLAVVLSAMEMIRNGTTCFLEAGTVMEPSAAARASEHVGIRAVIGDAFIWDQPQGLSQGDTGCSICDAAAKARPVLKRAPRDFDEAMARMGGELFRNKDPDALVTGHVVILGLGTASERLMLEAKACADAAGVVLNLHQSYSPADTEADRRQYGGVDPLVHLGRIGFLAPNIVFGHANHLTDAECEVILETGPSIAWAPAASMMWGRGSSTHGRHAELWRRGANIALGSDSPNWSNDFDIWRQANLAVMAARDVQEDRTYLVAEDGLYMATRGGAKACGMDDQLGSIEVGKRADIVIHTLDRPEMIPTTNMIRNLFYASRSKSVHTVIVDGKVVLDAGRFTTFDETEALATINEASHALFRRAGKVIEPNRIERPLRSVHHH